jgi:hypothetical protein
MKQIFVSACLSGLVLAMPVQAGPIEDLLANPAIQSWLNRQAEVGAVAAKCKDAVFRSRNPLPCQQTDDAQRLLGMPSELRVLLSRPATSTSIRELCLEAQGLPLQESYLCAELYKADPGFRQLAEQQRTRRYEARQDRP